MAPSIRPYRPGDREALLGLWSACRLTRPWNDPGEDLDRKLAHAPDHLLLLEDGGEVVGSVMVGYEGHRGWLNYLAVHPDHQGKGLGRLLVERAEHHLDALGCPKVNLQVRAANPAVGFYRRLGYTTDEVVSLGKRLRQDEPSGGHEPLEDPVVATSPDSSPSGTPPGAST